MCHSVALTGKFQQCFLPALIRYFRFGSVCHTPQPTNLSKLESALSLPERILPHHPDSEKFRGSSFQSHCSPQFPRAYLAQEQLQAILRHVSGSSILVCARICSSDNKVICHLTFHGPNRMAPIDVALTQSLGTAEALSAVAMAKPFCGHSANQQKCHRGERALI